MVVAYGQKDCSTAAPALAGRVAGVGVAREKKASYTYTAEVSAQQVFNTEGYSTIHENGFKDVFNNPLSTFSISYNFV